MLLNAFATFLAITVRPAFASWAATHHVIIPNITTSILPDYIMVSTNYPTGSVFPACTSIAISTGYHYLTQNGLGGAMINMTTSYLILLIELINLPILTDWPNASAIQCTKTNYYIPLTVSNPASYTLTNSPTQTPSEAASRDR